MTGKQKGKAANITNDNGPLTLDEARALVQAKQPKAARRPLAKAATPQPPASPARVAVERSKLKQERREELARRVREYKATMTILKRRGARPPSAPPKKGAKAPVAKAGGFTPLQILAEGDSWFDYPYPLFGGGIIPRLETRTGVPILNLAKAGDESRYMLGVEERKILASHLANGSPAGGKWDVLLFSGGGNDVVDNPMALWIKDFDATVPPAQLIDQPRYDAALALVRAAYEDLIALRDSLSPTTHLLFHAYDFAIPDGRGVCWLGPWLKPAFDLHKFPNLAARQAVVRAMLQQFAAMLTGLASRPGVTFVNGQGTLPAQPSGWHNELHPNRDGFNKFADLFHDKLKGLFPGRVA